MTAPQKQQTPKGRGFEISPKPRTIYIGEPRLYQQSARLAESILIMSHKKWHERFQELSVKYSHFGIWADIGAMSTDEIYGLYRFLCRLDGEK
jgi:hypothetical protein